MKRKRKSSINTIEKMLFSLLICITLILCFHLPGKMNEASAASFLTQPIDLIHNLLVYKSSNQNVATDNTLQFLEKVNPFKKGISITENGNSIASRGKEDERKKPTEPSFEEKNDFNISADPVVEEKTAVPVKNEKQFETSNQPSDDKKVYLTFDDGPTSNTGLIVDTLNSYGMKATFFMLEPNMKKHPEEITKLINGGNVPALHGVSHDVSKIYRSKDTVIAEMDKAQQTLHNLTGAFTNLIRTPYGSAPYMKPAYKEAVKAAGYQLWDWTIDSQDWKYKNGDFVSNVIEQMADFPQKDKPIIILLHDNKTTADHLHVLLDYLKSGGFATEVINPQLAAYHF